jgi:hypothetical protein
VNPEGKGVRGRQCEVGSPCHSIDAGGLPKGCLLFDSPPACLLEYQERKT